MPLFSTLATQPATFTPHNPREGSSNDANSQRISEAKQARLFPTIATTLYSHLEASDNAANSSRIEELEAEIQKLQKSIDGYKKMRDTILDSSILVYLLTKFAVTPLVGCIPIVGFPLLGLQIACSILCVGAFVISNGISLYSFYLLKQKESLTQEKKSIQNALNPSTTETQKDREEKTSFFADRTTYFMDCAVASFFASCSLSPLLNCVIGLPIRELAIALNYITAAALAIGGGFMFCFKYTLNPESESASTQGDGGSNTAEPVESQQEVRHPLLICA